MKRRYDSGFTLIELTVVLLLITLLLGGLFMPLATSIEQSERQETLIQLNEIKKALYGYGMVNGRLPCPDCNKQDLDGCSSANDGREDLKEVSPNKLCASLYGNLPWATLGVDKVDAWNQHFTYRVTQGFAYEIANTTATAPCKDNVNTAFDLCTSGKIMIGSDSNGSADVAEAVAAIVISHGKDYMEDVQSDNQRENKDDNVNFVYRQFSRDYTNQSDFDDLMIWISPAILKNYLVMAEKLP